MGLPAFQAGSAATGGKAVLGMANYAWVWSTDKGDAKEMAFGGKDCLYLKIGPEKGGDWRLPLSLSPGRYRLEGKLQWKGIKAGGEGGTTPALSCIVNGVVDALKDVGVYDITMPVTPFHIWQAIQDAAVIARSEAKRQSI